MKNQQLYIEFEAINLLTPILNFQQPYLADLLSIHRTYP